MTKKVLKTEQEMRLWDVEIEVANLKGRIDRLERFHTGIPILPSDDDTIDYGIFLLQLIGSLTLCDHMGDVADDIKTVLETMGVELKWNTLYDLGKKLGAMGITTLYGTELGQD